ncbi:hypothetical protein [Absidia glauca]|uniref:Uncharacterized protein n=1 Tax=Absidia glauca TaxID=4829 RepID=A0A163K1D4_ABSGL|nr:hypothetical protein [Absidia glauca]
MPFRCKCGRTFEKPSTFSTHTSSCAPFHHRRLSASSPPKSSPMRLDMTSLGSKSPDTSPLSSSPTMDYPSFMPTALTIQNAFEGVRRRSLSYDASLK